ncbi:hypothetical protein SAMN04244560_01539 [Thermoanaerobacter thermohydrosulfuricus]|uniref:Helix-turn-helix conjugative transposon-like domain-containing protein n=2 Tax=Thermoanaerobacter thermohydrosulfuricus TaxID=1516 RepID=M8DES3_THETY|nr:hypothetical protein TthWC1_1943 [Thermoanaerobacter thermohydrosulfuricus WC1]SDF95732.1 hypothetical protein SAMN04244560_01539 [Thermoanaerobacter thermohydrosulfuricus]
MKVIKLKNKSLPSTKPKEKDEKKLLEIIDKFKPLLNKYKKKLGYDGAEEDLLLWLLKTITKLKG